ncbi:MAG: glutathione S-transferase [Caulobacter sp.]|nr:glutathione S-transferase [Vitreoscilla sp.]
MADYDLYYWQMPFRGQFVRAILAWAAQRWSEHDDGTVSDAMEADVRKQAIPFKGPPMLVERATGFALAEMPAIAFWLGEKHGLMPASLNGKALSLKVVNDANDVIDELSLDGGKQMWSPQRWQEYQPRLKRWMAIFEETGRRHGLSADAGHLLGDPKTGVADIVTATLWGTLAERFPAIGELLDAEAPAVAGLVRRLMAAPALSNLARVSREQFGDSYCGGDIEKSMKRVINHHAARD